MTSGSSKFVRLKIILAYLAIAFVGSIAVGYVLSRVVRFSESEDVHWQLKSKNQLVNRTLFYMYKAENDGFAYIVGIAKTKREYDKDLNIIYASLDSLKTFVADSAQVARIDTITYLFEHKDLSFRRVARVVKSAKIQERIDAKIEEMLPDSSDLSKKLVAETHVNVKRDTVITKRSTGNFRKRFKNLFKKTEADSSVFVSVNSQADTVHIAMADSINAVLMDLRTNIADLHSESVSKQKLLWKRLVNDNSDVNDIIYRLISSLATDETRILVDGMVKREAEWRDMVKYLGIIAIIAVFLIIISLWIIWRDLTKINRYRKELEYLNAEKSALIDAREKLMLAITHDIKSPMNSIIGYTDLMERLTTDRRQLLYLDNIKTSSEMVLALVNDLLEFYKLDRGVSELDVVPFNLKELFASIYQQFLPEAEKKGISLDFHISGIDFEVESDPLKLRQLINNLVSNAIKFTDEGSVTLNVVHENGRIIFDVIDTGRGMTESERESLFEMFVRLSSAKGVAGFGLGLSIVDRIVKLLDAEIYVESEKGKGSRFYVEIPARKVDAVAQVEADKKTEEQKPVKPCRVLLIDDDELQVNMLAEICRNNGIDTEKCMYPALVEKMIQATKFDLVITDVQMPEMDGFQVLSKIKAISDVPVVAVTAREVTKEEYQAEGFADVVMKPFKASTIINVIRELTNIDIEKEVEDKESSGLDALTAFADDDYEAKSEILTTFVKETEENLSVLTDAVNSNDFQMVKMMCHKMVSIFTMIKQQEITDVLLKYERGNGELMMNNEELAFLKTKIDSVLEEARKQI